ncbi:MAG: CAP domain-containing protein [Bacillota bacterium]|jgi:uncharacterized YkwD family protein
MKKNIPRISLIVSLLLIAVLLLSSAALAAPNVDTVSKTCSQLKAAPQSIFTLNCWEINNCIGKLNIDQVPTSKTQPAPVPNTSPTPKPQPKAEPKSDSTPAANTTPISSLTADEQKMIDLVNAERTSRGLQALKVDMRLVTTARMKSRDMIDKGYFSHNSPTYGSPFDLMKSQGITYRFAGENIAGMNTVEGAHNGLMNSEGHRANILSPNFTHIGIGIIDGGPYGKMFTQHFIG